MASNIRELVLPEPAGIDVVLPLEHVALHEAQERRRMVEALLGALCPVTVVPNALWCREALEEATRYAFDAIKYKYNARKKTAEEGSRKLHIVITGDLRMRALRTRRVIETQKRA